MDVLLLIQLWRLDSMHLNHVEEEDGASLYMNERKLPNYLFNSIIALGFSS